MAILPLILYLDKLIFDFEKEDESQLISHKMMITAMQPANSLSPGFRFGSRGVLGGTACPSPYVNEAPKLFISGPYLIFPSIF